VSGRVATLLLLAACGAACDRSDDGASGSATGAASSRAHERLEVELVRPVPGDPRAAAPLVAQARVELSLGRQDVAQKRLEEALAADPANLEALIFQGTLLLAKGLVYDPSLALIAFRTARLVDPESASARVGEAVAHAELENDERAQELVGALLADDAAGRVKLIDEQRAALRRSSGRLALRAAQLDSALREADAALALKPSDRASMILRAEVLERSGRPDDAEAQLQRALQLRPEDASAHFARARVLRRLGRAAEAEQETRIHQALVPFEEVASKAFRTDWPRRIELRRQLLAAWPEFRRGHHLLVRELLGGGEFDAARSELATLLAEQPDDAEALFLLAKTLAKQGDKTGARAAADQMLQTGRASPEIHADLLRTIEAGTDE